MPTPFVTNPFFEPVALLFPTVFELLEDLVGRLFRDRLLRVLANLFNVDL